MNAATNGCSFDKRAGSTHERSLGGSCEEPEVVWTASGVEEESAGRISRRWAFSFVSASFFVSSYTHSSDFPEIRQ